MPWAAQGVSPRLANGGCDANVTDIVTQGSIAYVTAEAPNPGCWEGFYAANISDGSLIYNMHCLGGSVGLAIANGWMYRASHNHDCSKQDGGYVGPNDANNFIWYRLEAHRLSDGRLGHWSPTTNGGPPGPPRPSARRSSRPTARASTPAETSATSTAAPNRASPGSRRMAPTPPPRRRRPHARSRPRLGP